ncbi:MAG TPA: Os1348 family NHLP clan protein, partial [Chloroflexota bacterium]|nr:Os1348 family NHLP clan protein [Chloroflexota bacterium]
MAEPPSEQENGQPVPRRELSSGFQDMLGRMISDPEFRREMAADPEQALWEAGIELSPQELERVRSMSADDR